MRWSTVGFKGRNRERNRSEKEGQGKASRGEGGAMARVAGARLGAVVGGGPVVERVATQAR